MPKIVFDQVEKSFGNVRVLSPFDLQLEDGEFTVLVGPSGCGKSTTLRILAGLETPSGGEIYFDERPISHLEPKARDMAMVFQDYALYPHMNIAKNMSFALRLQRTPKKIIDEKVTRVAKMLGIEPLLKRKPAELSGGQRQRVAMGRALVRDAGTFLFDEPLSNLDAKLRAKLRAELAQMRENIDKNMVYVTHDQVEAMTLGDRIVVMSGGVIQQQGTPEELFKKPVNRFVAGFIGSPTMNFLEGEISQVGSDTVVSGDSFTLPLSASTAQRIQNSDSKQVLLGIRPSSFSTDASEGGSIELRVLVSEYLGANTVLVTRCGERELLVETESDKPIATGSQINLSVKTEELMLFDKTTEKAV